MLGAFGVKALQAFPTGQVGPQNISGIAFVPNVLQNGVATGMPGIQNTSIFIDREYTAPSSGIGHASADLAPVQIYRNSNYTGGGDGLTQSSLKIQHQVQANVVTNEWAILCAIQNFAGGGLATTAVAAYLRGAVFTNASPTWGAVISCEDHNGNVNPVFGQVTLELDCTANGTDNAGNRVMCDMVGGRFVPSGAINTISYGCRIGGKTTDAYIKNGIYLTGNFDYGIYLFNDNPLYGTGTSAIADIATKGKVGIGTKTPAELLSVGLIGTTLGVISLAGNIGGKVIIQPQANGGTFNFNLPASAGAPGQVLTSGGGASAAMAWSSPSGQISFVLPAVNFNATGDTQLTIVLPNWATRYQIAVVTISHASASLNPATAGLFTGAGATGQTLAATQAITVTATADATVNNSQGLTVTNATSESYQTLTLFFNVAVASTLAATADVTIILRPLP